MSSLEYLPLARPHSAALLRRAQHALGCAILLLPLFRFFDYRRFSRWTYTPLLASFALFALLLTFGSGPTGSDSKVNLGPFQPVEVIKVLLVLFLAGYFSANWERLRELREKP